MDRPTIELPVTWRRLADKLARRKTSGAVYILGEPDSGKSVLADYLCRHLAESGHPTEYIDLDPGQSRFGPPTTLALANWPRAADPQVEALRFVGSTSPPGSLLQHAAAASALLHRNTGARWTVIDGCGFVQGAVAEEFQYNLLDLLRPHVVIRLGNSAGPLHSTSGFEHSHGMEIHGLPLSPAAKTTTPDERLQNRLRSYADYFRNARQGQIKLSSTALHGKIPNLSPGASAGGLLFAFCNSEQWVLALGIVSSVDPGGDLQYVAPPFRRQETAALQFGSLRLLPEEGRLVEQ